MQLTVDFTNRYTDGLTNTLGISYHSTDDPQTLEAHLPCTAAVAQPWGCMSGGAFLALAENTAGVASMCVAPGYVVLGINVSANHVGALHIGETAIATARAQHLGRTLHNWLVEIRNDQGALVSSAQVTNFLIKEEEK